MKKHTSIVLSVLVIASIVAVFSYFRNAGNSDQPVQARKIQAVASFYPLYYFSQRIGGDQAEVTDIVPSGAEPHDYEPTAQDMARMEHAEVIVLNGGGLEAWSDTVQKTVTAGGTTVVIAGEGLTTRQMEEDGEIGTDPHVWLDPSLAEKMVDRIVQGFRRADPANGEYYQANADALKNELHDLDLAYEQGLRACKEKDIITSHAAFGYMAATYGFNQVPIAGLSPDAEPSSRQMADIVKFAKDHDVRYIFFESLVSPKLAQTIATEVGAQTLVLDPIEGLSDEDVAQGKNYLTVMRDNLTNIRTALQCNE